MGLFSEQEVLGTFPGPAFRKYQKESLMKMTEGFNSGARAILIDAPTG